MYTFGRPVLAASRSEDADASDFSTIDRSVLTGAAETGPVQSLPSIGLRT